MGKKKKKANPQYNAGPTGVQTGNKFVQPGQVPLDPKTREEAIERLRLFLGLVTQPPETVEARLRRLGVNYSVSIADDELRITLSDLTDKESKEQSPLATVYGEVSKDGVMKTEEAAAKIIEKYRTGDIPTEVVE